MKYDILTAHLSRKRGTGFNCLDGEEDGDAPEKGGNGGGRPAHTGENSCQMSKQINWV